MTRTAGRGKPSDAPEVAAEIEALLARARERGLIDDRLAAELRALGPGAPAAAAAAVTADGDDDLAEVARRARAQRRRDAESRREGEEKRLREQRDRRAAAETAARERRARERADAVGAFAALRGDGAAGDPGDGWLPIAGGAAGAGDPGAGGQDILPLIYENVGWFIGALLVLTGSIYGLREAWISFDAAGRWASVAGALLIYHALFVMVSAVLARRSTLAGQFLAGIGACLAPLAYIAAANLTAQRLLPGLGAALILTGAAVVTLSGVGRRFGVGRALVPALLLPALTLLAFPHLGEDSPLRFALPIVALGGPWLVTRRAETRSSLGALILALFAALAAQVFALSSDASGADPALAARFHTGGPGFGSWLGLYVTALGLTLFSVKGMVPSSEHRRRALNATVWVGFAMTVGAGALGALAALGTSGVAPQRSAVLAALLAALVACAQARLLAARWREAGYLLLVLASLAAAVACRLIAPAADQRLLWAAAALLPVALHLGGLRVAPLPRFATELAVAQGAILLGILWSCEAARAGVYPFTLAGGLALAVGCHRQAVAGLRWHYLGALAAALAIGVALAPARAGALAAYQYAALATIYAVYALATRPARGATAAEPAQPAETAEIAETAAIAPAPKLSPLDDASLALFAIAGFVAMLRLSFAPAFAWQAGAGLRLDADSLAAVWPLLAASAGLLLRSLLDRSALPSTAGVLGMALAAVAVAGPRSAGAQALTLGMLALAAAGVAALATPPARITVLARTAFGARELPWAWSGRGAIAQGFGLAAFPLALAALLGNLGWFGQRAIDRPLAIAGAVALALTCAVLFATNAAATARLRGRAALLWVLAIAAATAALSNRIDRPLPPAVVARNLSLIGAALWLLARGVARSGAWLEERLAAPAGEGRRYHLVPHAGVAALAALLIVDAGALGPLPFHRGLNVVPPLMLIGPAILLLLLGRSARARWPAAAALPLLALGATLIGAQHALLGPTLVRLAGGATWVPPPGLLLPDAGQSLERFGGWQALPALYRGGLVGLAGAGAFFAAAALAIDRSRRAGRSLAAALGSGVADQAAWAAWLAGVCRKVAAVAVLLLAWWGCWSTSVTASLLALATGAALAARRGRPASVAPLLAAAALAVHTLAQRSAIVAAWPSAALGALAIGAALGTRAALAGARPREAFLARAHLAVAALVMLALVYGFAAGAAITALPGGWSLLAGAARRLVGWGASAVPALAIALGAAAALVAALSWNALARRRETALAVAIGAALAALALATLVIARAEIAGAQRLVMIAASTAVVAAALYLAGALLGPDHEELARGARLARDRSLVAAGALLALSLAVVRGTPSPLTPPAVMLALAILFGVSLAALLGEKRPYQVYFLGAATLGGYGFLRVTGMVRLDATDDAVALLALDFALIGLTVLARRRGLDGIATATRRFAAGVPILVGLLLPWQPSGENALFALAAAGFYGLLGWIEHNRVLGAFGSIAANLALLVLSLSQGLTGFDIYLAPLGLCTLVVVHLFDRSLGADARQALRFAATGLTYAPAALALVFQVGNAQNPLYPFAFAGACLLGIAAGMWFHIRAYLVLGMAFLVLDLGMQLVRASLRSQRLGFFVLSLAGLLILSGMVFYTMHREKVRAGLARLRRALATWG